MMPADGPFRSVLVPYDGSAPAQAALSLALATLAPGATLTVLTVVDESTAMEESAASAVAYDPTPLFDALDVQGRALLADARAICATASVTPEISIVHDRPVAGILAAAAASACDVIVMGTHARTGLARAFLGSTAAGVLQSSDIPVLTTRERDSIAAHPFTTILVAVDESAASDAALALAERMARAFDARLVVTHAADVTRLYDDAATYVLSPVPLEADIERESAGIVGSALRQAHIAAESVDVALVEGRPLEAILTAASDNHANVIVMGSHGRRGIRRFIFGSIAEDVVRESPLPVFVVRRSESPG